MPDYSHRLISHSRLLGHKEKQKETKAEGERERITEVERNRERLKEEEIPLKGAEQRTWLEEKKLNSDDF